MIKVLYFASLRDKLGQAEEQLDYSGDIAGLMGLLRSRGDIWSDAFADDHNIAVNGAPNRGAVTGQQVLLPGRIG